MQKISVFLREDQLAALKALSARTGARRSALVRQGVDLLLRGAAREASDWREATEAAAGLWRDRQDLDETAKALRRSVRARFAGLWPT